MLFNNLHNSSIGLTDLFLACSGVEIPKPTSTGMSVTSHTRCTIAEISVVIVERIPVTPNEDTQ